jgi:hypothetical protein
MIAPLFAGDARGGLHDAHFAIGWRVTAAVEAFQEDGLQLCIVDLDHGQVAPSSG